MHQFPPPLDPSTAARSMVSKLNLQSQGTWTSTSPLLTSARGLGADDEVGGVERAWHGDGADDELEVVRAEGDGGGLDGLDCADVLKKGKIGDEGSVRLKFESQPGILSW